MNAQIPVRNVRDRRSSNVYHGELISPTSKPKVNQSATMRASSLKNQDIEVEDWDWDRVMTETENRLKNCEREWSQGVKQPIEG